jgi:hypothetical protein
MPVYGVYQLPPVLDGAVVSVLLRYLLGSVKERSQLLPFLGDDVVESLITPAHLDVGLDALLGDVPAPYTVKYMAKDGPETCLSLNSPKAYRARDGAVKETRLELEFKRYETYEDKMREVYKPKELLAFATAAREYVRLL